MAPDMDATPTNDNVHATSSYAAEDHVLSSQSAGSQHRSPMNSDIQSEFSGESAVSHNSSSRGAEASGDGTTGRKPSTVEEREINAIIEVLKAGSIPGDVVPIRIRVHHNRRLKSMHGVIVTLYRQGRVDYEPPIHMFADLSKEDAERLERDEYYPKSKTGLGGLSLSSAGSCSVFRKDLYQTVNPLIVDPRTLTATINTSVRVPEDAFPSIKGVPGALISFRYYVEVVVDLAGRLSGSGSVVTQSSSRLGGGGLANSNGIASSLNAHDNNNSGFAGTIVDTDHLRREKGVISVATEITVGTTDSSRLKKSKSVVRPSFTIHHPSVNGDGYHETDDYPNFWEADQQPVAEITRTYSRDHRLTAASYDHPPDHYTQSYEPAPDAYDVSHHVEGPQTPLYVPRPELPEHSGLSEKELARRAEQRLLPSEPGLASPSAEAGPSQPVVPSFEEVEATPVAVMPNFGSDMTPVSTHRSSSHRDNTPDEPSAPSFADLSAALPTSPIDDKQELERRRLMEEASAPPEVPEEYAASIAGPSAPTLLPPSAPVSLGYNGTASSPSTAGPSAPPAVILSSYHDGNGGPFAPSETELDEDHDNERYGTRAPMNMFAGASSTVAGPSEPLPRYER